MDKGTILCIDDDENLQFVVEQYLSDDGYRVITASNAQTALEKVESAKFDIILLDLVLPDGEGLTLIPQFKSKSAAPIIVVSGKDDTTDKVVCLEMGADDYLTKPFELRELSARIKVVIRRSKQSEDIQTTNDNSKKAEKVEFGDGWILDRSRFGVYKKANNDSAGLTTGEFQLLDALIHAPNRALSREQLFELTRDGEFDVYDRAIDIQIARIRKKLNDDKGDLIKTIRGVGYMFIP